MDTYNEYIVEGEIGKTLDNHSSPLVQNVVRSHELPDLAAITMMASASTRWMLPQHVSQSF